MLLGRAFQSKTYETLSFDRDYKSYFPVTVRLKTDTEIRIPLSDLKAGDHIIVRNNELIPADATLRQGAALIDYSFVSGESAPVYKAPGEIIYAGARQTGSSIELEVVKSVAQSYLTELWNNEVFLKKENQEKSFMDRISHWFSLAVFMISLNAGLYWMFMNAPDKAINAATAVLIVACPCALLLSGTFTNGAILRILGKNNLYLKNAAVIEKLADIDTVVFDKTGTLTSNGKARVLYDGIPISVDHQNYLYSAVMHSTHPFSRAIASILPIGTYLEASSFKELPGLGIEAQIEGHTIKVGSKAFIEPVLNSGQESGLTSCVYVSIDGFIPGCFRIKNEYRKGLGELLHQMKQKFHLVMLSGDNEGEKPMLSNFFKGEAMFFKQSPQDKLDAIRNLQKQGRKVLMLGDGLNDAGALKQSDTGFAVSDETMNFSPACDGIMDGAALYKLNQFIGLSQAGRKIITASFIISILYNFFGIYFAVAGNLRPVIAAILMPASTVSIVLFTTGITTLTAKRFNLK
jgi:Cu+-exporting ATPase